MDARQALGPRMGPAARSSRERGRSEGTPERSAGAVCGSDGFWFVLPRTQYDQKGLAVRAKGARTAAKSNG